MCEYLREDGNGHYARYRVPDLIPPDGVACELVIVLESPHIDELRTGIPVSGKAGQASLRFLAPAGRPSSELLGPFVASLHASEDFRVSIINSSPVPLQRNAFSQHPLPPELSDTDWDVLEAIQKSQAQDVANLSPAEREANQILSRGLQSRFTRLSMTEEALIFLAGIFVQRTWALLSDPPSKTTLEIPHPSHSWWTRTKREECVTNLEVLKRRFEAATS